MGSPAVCFSKVLSRGSASAAMHHAKARLHKQNIVSIADMTEVRNQYEQRNGTILFSCEQALTY